MNTTYVRWSSTESRRGRVFDGDRSNHPATVIPCGFCHATLGDGEPWQAFILGPDPDAAHDQLAHADGSWYAARAVIVHKECLDDIPDDQLEQTAAEFGPQDRLR